MGPVSPQRMERPWQGKIEKPPDPAPVRYDPECYLCPGNLRAGGVRNPDYKAPFLFDNDFAALVPQAAPQDDNDFAVLVPQAAPHEDNDFASLVPESSPQELDDGGLMVARSEKGICRVVCFSERHDLTLGLMTEQEIRNVLNVWGQQYRELASFPWINHVQIFENRGAIMGASNPHPHCQIWANATLPNQVEKEWRSQLEYQEQRNSCLLCDYCRLELKDRQRIVCQNRDFVVLVPFWAIWPFEVMLLSVRHLGALDDLTSAELASLAEILRRLCIRYDNLFAVPFPYTMGFHQRPTDGSSHPEWHFHAHYYPPLLRSATVAKFMVGYEMLASPQRDLTPESAAERLRSLSEEHYQRKPEPAPHVM